MKIDDNIRGLLLLLSISQLGGALGVLYSITDNLWWIFFFRIFAPLVTDPIAKPHFKKIRSKNSLAKRMKRGKCSLLHFHCGKRTFHTHLWSGKSTIPWHCKHFQHYWVFDYLHSNLLTDDPHYPSGWQVRHILHQMKCTWRQFQLRSCKTETTWEFVALLLKWIYYFCYSLLVESD